MPSQYFAFRRAIARRKRHVVSQRLSARSNHLLQRLCQRKIQAAPPRTILLTTAQVGRRQLHEGLLPTRLQPSNFLSVARVASNDGRNSECAIPATSMALGLSLANFVPINRSLISRPVCVHLTLRPKIQHFVLRHQKLVMEVLTAPCYAPELALQLGDLTGT